MLDPADSFETLRATFSWNIPTHYNIGVDICDRWAERDPERLAIIDADESGHSHEYSFGDLKALSNQLANGLLSLGVGEARDGFGDRIGVLLPQCVETAVTHIASAKLGGIAIPLFTLFGPDALLHRLKDSGARAIVTDASGVKTLMPVFEELPALKLVLCIDHLPEWVDSGKAENPSSSVALKHFQTLCDSNSSEFKPRQTRANDPALLIYTSGTTGNPKGALHAHRVLLGHLPGVEVSHNFLPQPDDRFWTPADWAWIGGLLDVLMPALHHGIPVVACRFEKFSADAAFELMRKYKVRNAFLPPTALKMMRQHSVDGEWNLDLRSVASGGETLGTELIDWGQRVFGTTINEFYGQTECNMVISSCCAMEPATPGVMGRPVPGHNVAVIDEENGTELPTGVEGTIAVEAGDPVMLLEYWGQPDATEAGYCSFNDGDVTTTWWVMGDRGELTEDGKIRFIGRDDDVISSAGYRIGPAEVEDCLLTHPAVALAGVVGQADDLRGSIVVAYVTLAAEAEGSDALSAHISEHVKQRLAAHEYPRIVRFIEDMPMTTTGKIIRRRLREMAAEEIQGF